MNEILESVIRLWRFQLYHRFRAPKNAGFVTSE